MPVSRADKSDSCRRSTTWHVFNKCNSRALARESVKLSYVIPSGDGVPSAFLISERVVLRLSGSGAKIHELWSASSFSVDMFVT